MVPRQRQGRALRPAKDESPCPESARRTLENDRGPLHRFPCHEEPSTGPAPGPATPTCCGVTPAATRMWFMNGTTVSSATGVGVVSTAWSVNSTTGQYRNACMDPLARPRRAATTPVSASRGPDLPIEQTDTPRRFRLVKRRSGGGVSIPSVLIVPVLAGRQRTKSLGRA
jgi:hypothetical protein